MLVMLLWRHCDRPPIPLATLLDAPHLITQRGNQR
jgi:hypothetical protein